MSAIVPYQLLADTVLVVHFGVVLFVVGGLALVPLTTLASWLRTRAGAPAYAESFVEH